MKSVIVAALAVAFLPGVLPVDAASKPILCKKMGKTVPLAYFGEGSRGITYTTNFPKSYMVYNKLTKKCKVYIKVK